METLLKQIIDEINTLITTFRDLINLEISVVDNTYKRIAGTGEYEKFIGLNLPEHCSNSYVIKTGKYAVITDPLHHKICETCTVKDICLKEFSIVYPINNTGITIGVVSVGAFNAEQKKYLMDNTEALINFLDVFSRSMSSKIELLKSTTLINTIIHTIDECIITTDYLGKIKHYNRKADTIYNISGSNKKNIIYLIPEINLEKIYNENNIDINYAVNTTINGIKSNFVIKKIDNSIHSDIILISNSNSTDLKIQKSTDADDGGENTSLKSIVGISDTIIRAKEIARDASKYDSNVLIIGDSGTGKELFARGIHEMSMRGKGPFVVVNCAAIPENLFESELFGYEEGAFTGASKKGKMGKFELANNGTLFLDEIGDLSLFLQPKLLRAIEYGEVVRVGGTKSIHVNARIIAATNRNLEDMVKDKLFREDLFYRLNVIPLNTPSLKDRREDILLLSKYFLDKFSRKFSKNIYGFSEEVEKKFLVYDWPGNIREMINIIEYCVHAEKSQKIQMSSLPVKLRDINLTEDSINFEVEIKEIEKQSINQLLNKYGGSVKGKEKIAEILGISMSTLYRRIKNIK